MIKYVALAFTLVCSFYLNAQQVEKLILTANPNPSNLTQKNEVHALKSILKIFKYDNDEIDKGIGNNSAAHSLGAFIEIPNTTLQPYKGKTIDYIRFGIDNNTIISSVQLAIYEDKLEGTPVITQNLLADSIVKGWNLFKLDESYTLGNKTIFVGLAIETNAGGYTQTYDTDPTQFPQFSGHTILNGEYYGTLSNEIAIDADYNIQAFVTDGQGVEYNDLAIVGIKPSTDGCGYSAMELLKVTILNKGNDSIYTQFNLTANINGIEITQQVSPTVFYPNIEKVINLPSFDMSAYGVYSIQSSFDYADATPENNEFPTTILSGDAVLRIDLLTDVNPEETSWKLIDKFGNIVIQNDPLEAETEYSTELCVIDSDCYTWVISDSYGDGMEGSGLFTLYYNDSIIAVSPENGNFGFEFSAYGIGNGCKNNDVVLTKINLPTVETPQPLFITGTIYNNGTDTLNSFEVEYKVDDFTSIISSINGITIPIGSSFDFTHDVPYTFFVNGTYLIDVIISNPNGVADENSTDNTKTHKIIIDENAIPKRQLIEHFTSSSNEECFSFTPELDFMLVDNFDNYSLIRYPLNKPTPGDPYYIEQTGIRADFYQVNSIPSLYRNGIYNMDITQDRFNTYAAQKTIFSIEATALYLDNLVSVNATIHSIINFEAGLSAHIAIIENNTTGNIGTNGETDFYNVLMQMLPDEKGTALGNLENGGSKEISLTFDMSTTFVEEMFDLAAVIFVQDDSTKEVLQSIQIPVELVENINATRSEAITVYPNPFSNSITIDKLQIGSSLLVSNVMGQLITTVNHTGTRIEINTENFKSGIYIIKITDAQMNITVKKIVKR